MFNEKLLQEKDSALLYEWNNHLCLPALPPEKVYFLDETLRDGLQASNIKHPALEAKLEIIKLMCELGIDYLDIGFPGASDQIRAHLISLIKEIINSKLPIKICCAARTHPHDIQAVIDVAQQTGTKIELLTFLGSSSLRSFIEGWDIKQLGQLTAAAVEQGIEAGLPVSFVTEDTTRTHPDTLDYLFKTAIQAGASRLVLCDTVGYSTPQGVETLVNWTRCLLSAQGIRGIGLDWHGHNDKGLATINAIHALQAGCDRIHATGLGIGERAGNTAMEQLLTNLKLMNLVDNNLLKLTTYCQQISHHMQIDIPENYPIVGFNAFTTATGVHAAAILKALESRESDLADQVYSSVPASLVGRSQSIQIGPMSGRANVIAWFLAHEIKSEAHLIEKILAFAKNSDRTLNDSEIYSLL